MQWAGPGNGRSNRCLWLPNPGGRQGSPDLVRHAHLCASTWQLCIPT